MVNDDSHLSICEGWFATSKRTTQQKLITSPLSQPRTAQNIQKRGSFLSLFSWQWKVA